MNFMLFYQTLYTPESPPSASVIQDYLQALPTPSNDHVSLSDLEEDLSLQDISRALETLKKGKTTGPDGFSVEFYLHFSNLLLPRLLHLYQSFLLSGKTEGTFQEAMICLIYKEGRDHKLCKNYQPISLVNVDYKVFAKVLALRLDPIIPSLAGKEQCGFVKGRLTSDNSRLFLNVLNKTASFSKPLAAISVDAEKAFDRVDWSFRFASLRWHGFGPKLISLISLLYSAPGASVLVNGCVSSYFSLKRGVRQGCPLSFLF